MAVPTMAPMIGPTTGTQEYAQSEPPLPRMGRMAWAMRGPRSRAGLMAYPVGPPREVPMTTMIRATPSGPIAVYDPPATKTHRMRTAVPMASVRQFHP